MKLFIRRIVFTGILAAGMVFIVFYLTGRWINSGPYFKIDENKTIAVFGHSHSNNAFNDTIIKNCINLSESMEGYIYTYFKLKTIVENNPHIRTVLVEYTNNQLGYYAEDRLWGLYLPELLPKHFAFLDFKTKYTLFKYNPLDYIKTLPLALKSNVSFLFDSERNYIVKNWSNDRIPEKFQTDTTGNKKSANLASQSGIIGNNYSACMTSMWYLAKIAKYCNEKNIALFFVRSPCHSPENSQARDSSAINDSHLQHRDISECLFSSVYTNEFPDIPLLDFADFSTDKSEFYDEYHLNLKGSIRFSHYFNSLVDKGLLTDTSNRDKLMLE